MKLKISIDELMKIKADSNGSHMLTDEQIMGIVEKVNQKVNIPIIGEDLEKTVFYKIVKLIDTKLYEFLPNEYYELINSLENGITKDEAAIMVKRLTELLNKHVNIPIIGEKAEAKLIKTVLEIIIEAMQKNVKL